MSMTCQSILISYGVICTLIIVVLSAFLAHSNGQQCDTLNVDGDSQTNSATKTDVGMFVFDEGVTTGSEGTACVCPKWTTLTVLEMMVMGTLSVLVLWGIIKLIKGLQGILEKRRTRVLETKVKKQEALEKKLMEKMRLEDTKRVMPAKEVGEEIEFDKI